MAIFNSYVKLPEGKLHSQIWDLPSLFSGVSGPRENHQKSPSRGQRLAARIRFYSYNMGNSSILRWDPGCHSDVIVLDKKL